MSVGGSTEKEIVHACMMVTWNLDEISLSLKYHIERYNAFERCGVLVVLVCLSANRPCLSLGQPSGLSLLGSAHMLTPRSGSILG